MAEPIKVEYDPFAPQKVDYDPFNDNVVEDMLKSGRAGLVRGAAGIPGIGGDARDLATRLGDWAGKKLGLSEEQTAKAKTALSWSPPLALAHLVAPYLPST